MKKRVKPKMEFRYYKVPPGSPVLALLGQKWVQNYGNDIDYLHFHNYMEIGYCYEGIGELILGDKSRAFTGNTFSVIPKNYPHTTNSKVGTISRWEYLFIDVENFISETFADNIVMRDLLMRRLNQKAIYLPEENYPDMAEMILKILNLMREGEEFYLDEIRGILTALLLEIARYNRDAEEKQAETKSSILISRALDYVSDYYQEPLRIETLAEVCHISETHFRRVFTACMGMPPIDYINLVRIHSACEYMRQSKDSVSDIAHKVGYDTLSTFNRNFKKFMGESPKKWLANPENYERKLLDYRIHTEEGW